MSKRMRLSVMRQVRRAGGLACAWRVWLQPAPLTLASSLLQRIAHRRRRIWSVSHDAFR